MCHVNAKFDDISLSLKAFGHSVASQCHVNKIIHVWRMPCHHFTIGVISQDQNFSGEFGRD